MPRISKAEWRARVDQFREDFESGDPVRRVQSLQAMSRPRNLPNEVKAAIEPYLTLALKDQEAVVRFEALRLVPPCHKLRDYPELEVLVTRMAAADPSPSVQLHADFRAYYCNSDNPDKVDEAALLYVLELTAYADEEP